MLLRHAEVAGRLEADLRVSHAMVTEVASALRRRGGEPVYDCQGGAGITAVTDATPDLDARAISAIERGMTCGILPPADRPDLYRCATLLSTGDPGRNVQRRPVRASRPVGRDRRRDRPADRPGRPPARGRGSSSPRPWTPTWPRPMTRADRLAGSARACWPTWSS